MRWTGHWLLMFFAATLTINPILAQNRRPVEARLRVTVVDQTGAAIPNARVTINKQERTLTTGKLGDVSFSDLAPGKYQLQVTAVGFAPGAVKDVNVRAGVNAIEIKLDVAGVKEEVTVGRDKREAGTDPRGAFSTVLTEEQIAQLPDDPEEFEQALRNLAGPGATFRVNGFRGGKLPPKSQIREIRFRTNAYAAENHESSFMNVDIFTKPGLENWHGGFNLGFRDESLNARNAFAPSRAAEQNRRFGFEFGGPLWKKHTSMFLSADGVNSYEAKTIHALLPESLFNNTIRQPWRMLNLNARVEHLLTPTHTSRAEYQRNATRRDNNGVGNFDLPERGYTTDSAEHVLRFADSGAVGKKLFNEIRFQTIWQSLDIGSLSDATSIQVLGAFASGGAQIASSGRSRELEIADNLDIPFKKHSMRAGFQFEASTYNSTDLRNQNGAFIFSSLEEFRAGRPTTFKRRSGAGRVDFDQFRFGTKSLSLSSIFNASSARPYNIITGFDDNKDLSVNDRPPGIGRNSARGAGQWDLSSRLSWGFSFGKRPDNQGVGGPQVRIIRGGSDSGEMLGAMGSMPSPDDKRFRTQFFIQATNVFNHVNLTGFSGVQTSPLFGQAVAALPGRRIETGMRFSF